MQMLKNLKIRTRVVIIVVLVLFAALLMESLLSFTLTRNLFAQSLHRGVTLGLSTANESNSAMQNLTKKYLQNFADAKAENINLSFREIQNTVDNMVSYTELLYKKNNSFASKKVNHVSNVKMDTLSSKYFLAPNVKMTSDIERELFKISNAEYQLTAIMEGSSILNNAYLVTESGIVYRVSKFNDYVQYDPREKDWYKQAIANPEKHIWTDTYVNAYGKVVITCARAIRNENGKPLGIVAVEVLVSTIEQEIIDSTFSEGSFIFILDKKGSYIGNTPIFDASESWYKAMNDIMNGTYQSRTVSVNGKDYFLFSNIRQTGWSFGLAMLAKNMSEPIEELQIKIAEQIENERSENNENFRKFLLALFLIFILKSFISLIFALYLANSMVKPLQSLTKYIGNIGNGDFKNRVPFNGTDEIAELGNAFNKMTIDLTSYIENLKDVTAREQQINREIHVAEGIQKEILPEIDDDFIDKKVKFYANMIPAKLIGGDFYDFFYLNDEQTKIAFVIADVSGKGIPASLYMATAKTMLKVLLLQTGDPVVALKKANEFLCKRNDNFMFVTALVITIDLNSGECVFINAGHNQPLISLGGSPYKFFALNNATALGMDTSSNYVTQTVNLTAGDKIYLYTDGVNEAMNESKELFGNERFLNIANNNIHLQPKEFCDSVRNAISVFAGGTLQTDDTTMLSINYLG
ncbi:hypothetical protein AGMMS49938_06570 [Fibrobacterales bacterium]|nr:hypothetical protein AGMMS49938_06570 [Fibrobacterales bacterium]